MRLRDLAIISSRPMLYADQARAAALGLPPHVRAASSAALIEGDLVVAQDDVHCLARIDLQTGLAEPIALPIEGPAQREKADKADLEACALLPDGRLLVMGSGSRPNRELAFAVDTRAGTATSLRAKGLFAALHAAVSPFGGGLNVEGVTIAGDDCFFLHRGPGVSPTGQIAPSVAVHLPTRVALASLLDGAEIAPSAQKALAVDLGELDGVKLAWTDGVEVYGVGLVFTACAEGTSNATDDGDCAGSALGVLDRQGRVAIARIIEADGKPTRHKVEGLAIAGDRALLVVDDDDASKPALLLEVPFGAASLEGVPPGT